MWIPPEDADPVLLHAPTRKSVSLFGAVHLRRGQMVTQFEKKFDAMTFHHFLRKLMRHRSQGRRLVVILDNARYHHAQLLAPFLQQHRQTLQLLFLPPYSPDLNPIERVWKLARRLSTHNRYFAELEDLVLAVSEQMQQWYTPNITLTRLCGII
jgi:transposase